MIKSIISTAFTALRRIISLGKRRIWSFLVRNVCDLKRRLWRKKKRRSTFSKARNHRLSSISISTINDVSFNQQTVPTALEERRDISTLNEYPVKAGCHGINSLVNGKVSEKTNSSRIRRSQFRIKSEKRSGSISRSSLLLTGTRCIVHSGVSKSESNYLSASSGTSLQSCDFIFDERNLAVEKTGSCVTKDTFHSFVNSCSCSHSGGWSTSILSRSACLVSSTPVKMN